MRLEAAASAASYVALHGLLVFEELVIGATAACTEAVYGPCSRRTVVTEETFAAKLKRLVPTAAHRSQLAHHALVTGFQRCLYVVADLKQIVRVVVLDFPSALSCLRTAMT